MRGTDQNWWPGTMWGDAEPFTWAGWTHGCSEMLWSGLSPLGALDPSVQHLTSGVV